MDERLQKQLNFILEIDKEKNIFRQTHLSGHGRRENDAEHAWHMAIMAYLLQEYSNEPVDVARVMLMCCCTMWWRLTQATPTPTTPTV